MYLKMGEKIIMIIISIYFNRELKRLRMSSPSRARVLCSVKILWLRFHSHSFQFHIQIFRFPSQLQTVGFKELSDNPDLLCKICMRMPNSGKKIFNNVQNVKEVSTSKRFEISDLDLVSVSKLGMKPILRSEVAHLPGLKTLEVKTKAGALFFSACLVICFAKHINQIESLKVVGRMRRGNEGKQKLGVMTGYLVLCLLFLWHQITCLTKHFFI